MKFTEEWFSEASQQALAELARATDGLDGAVIEIGCWEGRSTIALAGAVHPAEVYAVDTWQGSPGEISETLAGERDVYDTFRRNIAEGTNGNVLPYRVDWRAFMSRWNDPIRFVHIDATHTYTEVVDNIEAVRPHIVPGGIICGDDAHHEPIREAVRDTLGNAYLTASLWHWRFDG